MNELEGNNHQDDPGRDIQQPPTTIERTHPAINDADSGNRSDEKKTNWPQRIEAVCAVLLVIITGFYTYFAAGQLHKMNRAVKAAEGANTIAAKNLAETNRSWIEIRLDRYWEEADNDLPKLNEHLRKLRELKFPLTYTNVGKFPVTQIYITADVDILDSDKSPTFYYREPHYEMVRNILFPSRSDSIPAGFYLPTRALKNVDDALREKLESGEQYIAIYAHATFFDAFGEHYARFCAPLAFKEGRDYSFRPCIDYNFSGDGHTTYQDSH